MIAESVSTAVSRSNGRRPHRSLVKQHAEGKLVGGDTRRAASRLFGRHVAHGAEDHPVVSQRRPRRHAVFCVVGGIDPAWALGQTEVQHLDQPFRR